MTGETTSSSFDYVIIGGGSAGCVVANRLSADPKYSVLLIEAGDDWSPGSEPEYIRDPAVRTTFAQQYYWPGVTHAMQGYKIPVMQARVMGGGSSVNGIHAQRGLARDYDEWRQLGIEGWGWDDVLPYFKRIENDLDKGDDTGLHGKDGPVPVTRVPESKWSGLTLAVRDVLEKKLGLPRLEDTNSGYGSNGGVGDGTMAITLNNTADHRASSAIAYLTKDVRARPNLTIMSKTLVAKILFEGARAVGITLENGQRINAGTVFLCAGAVFTPALLLRSGVGPADELAEAGVAVVADRPGVGRHLLSHPTLMITAHLNPAGRQNDRSVRSPCTMIARYSSNVPGCAETDMQVNIWERGLAFLNPDHDPLNRQMALYMILLQKSYSEGYVKLDPANPGELEINFKSLDDPRDLDRMVQGFKMAAETLVEPPVAELVNERFIPAMLMGKKPDYMTAKLLTDSVAARVISTVGAFAMDRVPGMRKRSMAEAGLGIDVILALPEDKLRATLRGITSNAHMSGTCRMGAVDKRESVVDPRGRVIGVEGVRVVDASILPTMMNGGPNFPVMMSAEKISEMAIQDRQAEVSPALATAS